MKYAASFEITCAKFFSLILLLQFNIINKYVYIPNISLILGFLLGLSILSYYFHTGLTLNKIFPIEIWLYLIFGFFALGSGFLVAINKAVLIDSVMTYFQTVIYMVCLLAIVRYDKNLFYLEFLIICTAFFVSLIVLSGVSSISSALAGREDMFKNSITKVNPNSVGLLQSAAFLFQVIWLKKLRRNRHNIQRRRYLWLMIMVMFLMVMTLLVILISGSRKSMLAAVLTLVMMFIFSPKGKLFHKLMGITLSLVLIVAVFQIGQVFFNKVYIFRRFATFFNETSNTTRVNMIKEGFQLLGTSPFIGVGLGNYTYASSFGTYSHNTVAEALATTGLLGAIIYFSTYLIIFSKLVLFTKHPKTKEFAYNGIILFGVLAFLSIGVIHFYEILSSLLFTYLIAGLVIYKDNVRYS